MTRVMGSGWCGLHGVEGERGGGGTRTSGEVGRFSYRHNVRGGDDGDGCWSAEVVSGGAIRGLLLLPLLLLVTTNY